MTNPAADEMHACAGVGMREGRELVVGEERGAHFAGGFPGLREVIANVDFPHREWRGTGRDDFDDAGGFGRADEHFAFAIG